MDKKMPFIKNIYLFIISLMLIFCFLYVQIYFTAHRTVTNKTFYTVVLKNTGFAYNAANNIKTDLLSTGLANGIPEKVLTDAVNAEFIEAQAEKYFSALAEYLKTGNNLSEFNKDFTDALNSRISNYISENNITVDAETQKKLSEFIAQSEKIIVNNIIINYDYIKPLRQPFRILDTSFLYSVIIMAVLLVVLLEITSSNVSRALRWLGYALFSSGFITFTVSTAMLLMRLPQRINIISPYLKQFAAESMINILNLINTYSVIFLILGLVCIVSSEILFFMKKKSR